MNNLEPLMTSARSGEKSKDEWMTPLWLFDLLDSEFHFDLDPAASADNTLCDAWYSKDPLEAGDGLTSKWFGNVFVNPPYSQLKQWVEKGRGEILFGHANIVVMLIAARTDTRAWWDHVRHGEVRFLPGRLKFEHVDGVKFSAPFPSAVVIFERHRETKTIYWDIREPKK